MKTMFSSLLLGALLFVLAPATEAQRVVGGAYRGTYGASSGHRAIRYESSRVWVPGGYESVSERVWLPGRVERVWVEPVFEFRLGSCGSRFRVMVAAGHWRTVQHPGHYETRRVRVYVPGHWAPRGWSKGC
jgi:hypothetical protein